MYIRNTQPTDMWSYVSSTAADVWVMMTWAWIFMWKVRITYMI